MARRRQQPINLDLGFSPGVRNVQKPITSSKKLTSDALSYLQSLTKTSKSIQSNKIEPKVEDEKEVKAEVFSIEHSLHSLDISSEILTSTPRVDTAKIYTPHPRRDSFSSIDSVLNVVKSVDDLELATEIDENPIQREASNVSSEGPPELIKSFSEIETELNQILSSEIETVKEDPIPEPIEVNYDSDFDVESYSEEIGESVAETVPDEPISEKISSPIQRLTSPSPTTTSTSRSTSTSVSVKATVDGATQTEFENFGTQRIAMLDPRIMEHLCLDNYHQVMDVNKPIQMTLNSLLNSHLQMVKIFSQTQRNLYRQWNNLLEQRQHAQASTLSNGRK